MTPDVIAWKPGAPTPEQSSARLRCYRPCEYLRAAGWPCELFDPNRMNRYRVVVFQKAYSQTDLEIADHLRGLGVRTVFDLCDNHFYVPDDRPEFRARADRLRRILDRVDEVSVATQELGRLVDRPAAVIDDALDEVPADKWGVLRQWGRTWRYGRRPLRLIWFGNVGETSPPFGMVDLARILPALEAVHAHTPIALTVVSNSREGFTRLLGKTRFPATYHDWDTAHFPGLFRRHDVCLIPVNENPYTVCKTVNRLALSLLLGVPAVAERIPSYDELQPFARFGDWERSLVAYAADPVAGRRHVRQAREYLRAKYDRARVVRQWGDLLRPLAA